MGEFRYKAVDSKGQRKTGTVKSHSREMARSQLARMRLQVITIEAVKEGEDEEGLILLGGRLRIDKKGNIFITSQGAGSVPDKDLIVFTKQLQTMIASGVPLNQSLSILSRQQKIVTFGKIISKIQQSIESGSKFSEALTLYPKTFDTLYVAMVRAGEESGKISEILVKLVSYIEKASRIKRQIKSAMTYPALIVFVAVAVVSFLLVVVVPQFVAQFKSSGRALPELTQMVIDVSDFFVAKWMQILAGLIFFGYAFSMWSKTAYGRYMVHSYALKAPIVGDVVRKVAVGRFCSTMASMLSSGVNIIQALNICASSAGNVVIEKFIHHARGRVEQGQLLSVPVRENKMFPLMVVSMLEVGEKAGRMDEMLNKVSDFYDEEVDEAVKAMLSMIEPLLIVGIGIIVGILVVAMYLPIMDLGNTVGG